MTSSKIVFVSALISIFSMGVFAADQPVNSTCSIAWDYDAAELSRITGFQFFVNGKQSKELPKTITTLKCPEAGLIAGANTVKVRAYASGGLNSAFSNEITFTYNPAVLVPPSLKINLIVP